ncbi:MAG: prepilin-type N-terminal cleavage/methylation domain-containing protein [Neisseriaceae bacterium]|nr:prepilin-type N-terminal cleavage/methylation domain-containing protein [Neisseriaceae bacterium]
MLGKKQHGFTLTELMIVVAVLAILAGIAIPSYSHFTKKAQLRKAQAALLENAHALEQAYTQKKRFFDASKKLEITLPNESVGDPAKFAIAIDMEDTKKECSENGFSGSDKYCMTAKPTGAWANKEKRYLTLDHTGNLVCYDTVSKKTCTNF